LMRMVDQTWLQRLGKEFCLVKMANQAKGQARDFAFLASGKLCSTLQKQFSICVIFIWNKSLFLLPISTSFPCQASCVDSKTSLVHAGHAVPRTLLPS